MPTFRFDHELRGRRGVKRCRDVAVVAPAPLAVDPAEAERLLERLVVRERRRLGRALLRQHEPDAALLAVMSGEPGAPGGGVADDQLLPDVHR